MNYTINLELTRHEAALITKALSVNNDDKSWELIQKIVKLSKQHELWQEDSQ